MLKQSVRLATLICAVCLSCSPVVSLAAEPPVETNDSDNSIIIPTDYTDHLVNQLTRLTISISRRQVTLYKGKIAIKSYPIAVGRKGWETPVGTYRVLDKLEKPTWIHPWTGKAIPGGDPENPLGKYWIGFWTNGKNWIGFHGTPNPQSVGKAASHGCIRMYNKDVEDLFHQVNMGTPVTVTR